MSVNLVLGGLKREDEARTLNLVVLIQRELTYSFVQHPDIQ